MVWPAANANHLLVTANQMGQLEQQLFDSGLPVAALMEKAGLALAERLKAEAGLRSRGVVVLVGPGHNGGDGLVLARELWLAGWPVRIWSPFAEHKPLTAAHLRHCLWLGLPKLEQPPDPTGTELWLDAIFGIGQSQALPETVAYTLEQRQLCGAEIWSIDGPSGLCSDRGVLLGKGAARCSRSLVVGLWKQGLWQDSAMAWVGEQERIELNLPAALLVTIGSKAVLGLWGKDAYGPMAPQPRPDAWSSKNGRGRLRIIAGSNRYPGAARLSLEGASASGVGWLEAALEPGQGQQLKQLLPHVLWRSRAEGLDHLDAVVVGPGLGTNAAFPAGLQEFPGLLLLDADGLNHLAMEKQVIPWLTNRHGPTWITPHQCEFKRLFPQLVGQAPLEAAKTAAQLTGAQVLLKGAHSCIATPEGCCYQLLENSAWAARAGMGDVLAGYAGGLGALGLASEKQFSSAISGQLLALAGLRHGLAGMRLAQQGLGCANPLAVAKNLAYLQ
jgi:ADP-dependent NAD(P)H-hydrate dehydratase / NAD(P)H-hydrate epimerase